MKLPKQPQKGYQLIKWAGDALAWMRANTIRSVVGGKLKRGTNGITIVVDPARSVRGGAGHPFKATANGDDTVTIAAGKVLYCVSAATSGSQPNEPFTWAWVNFAETEVTVTATGDIYLVINTDIVEASNDSVSGVRYYYVKVDGDDGASLTAELDPVLTGDEFAFPIASVDLTDGIATVTQQGLDHNLVLQAGYTLVL